MVYANANGIAITTTATNVRIAATLQTNILTYVYRIIAMVT